MNMFILDRDPILAAEYNCDQHVSKILLESVQMLCHAHLSCGLDPPYKSRNHMNHPVSKWIRATVANYEWAASHALALAEQFRIRRHKVHKWHALAHYCKSNVPPLISAPMTPFHQSVNLDCVSGDPVKAYRLYYVLYKSKFATWTNYQRPPWYDALYHQTMRASY